MRLYLNIYIFFGLVSHWWVLSKLDHGKTNGKKSVPPGPRQGEDSFFRLEQLDAVSVICLLQHTSTVHTNTKSH